jgi:hypothetical protein
MRKQRVSQDGRTLGAIEAAMAGVPWPDGAPKPAVAESDSVSAIISIAARADITWAVGLFDYQTSVLAMRLDSAEFLASRKACSSVP